MKEEFKKYEKSIKKKYRFQWTPKFEEVIHTSLSKGAFIPIVLKTFEKLEWDIVFQDENSVEAKRMGSSLGPWDHWTEQISATYNHGNVRIKSQTLGNEMWDHGRNSKRVKLFAYAFRQTEKEYDKTALAKIQEDLEKIHNWDDYEVPETLPPPKAEKMPRFWIVIVFGSIIALALGYLSSVLSLKGIRSFIFPPKSMVMGLVIVFTINRLIKLSNYTNFTNLRYLLIGIILLAFTSDFYFEYLAIQSINDFESFSFLQFTKLRLEAGLIVYTINIGAAGLIGLWIFEMGFIYLAASLLISISLNNYQIDRVPTEVVDFTFYHFIKEKTEDEVRAELSAMGWSKKEYQDSVFESLGALEAIHESNKLD